MDDINMLQGTDLFKLIAQSPTDVTSIYSNDGTHLRYLSQSAMSVLGYDIGDCVSGGKFPIVAPSRGSIFCRRGENNELLLFRNNFWSRSEKGEIYTIDEIIKSSAGLESETAGDPFTFSLIVDATGRIISSSSAPILSLCRKSRQMVAGDLSPPAHECPSLINILAPSDYYSVMSKIECNTRCSKETTTTSTSSSAATSATTGARTVVKLHLGASESASQSPYVPATATVTTADATGYAVFEMYELLESRGEFGNTVSSSSCSSAKNNVAIFVHKATECDLREMREQVHDELIYLRDFRDNASLPMYSIDKKGTIVWANRAMIKTLGYAGHEEEYLRSDTTLYHVNKDLVSQMISTVLAGGLLEDFPCKIKRRDGKVLDVTYNSSAHFIPETGEFSHSRCIVHHNTEQKRLMNERDEMEQLQQASQVRELAAIEASAAKSQFLARMSHEIRTPINSITGASSLLAITPLTEEQREFVATINTSSSMLLSLVNNIMDISKIEKGLLELDITEVDFCELITDCARIMHHQAKEKMITLKVGISADFQEQQQHGGGWYKCDPIRVKQVILNLLSNAIKFSHERSSVDFEVSLEAPSFSPILTATAAASSSPSVELKTAPTCTSSVEPPCSKHRIMIEVKDSGIGIEDASELFQDYVQATPQVFAAYGGTGLGLSISKCIVESMGGAISLESEFGKGTTVRANFVLESVLRTVSIMPQDNGRDSSSKSSRGSNLSNAAATRRMRRVYSESPPPSPRFVAAAPIEDASKCMEILVAEDIVVNLKLLVRMLFSLGYKNVISVMNGSEALNKVKQKWEVSGSVFDVILMDCLMPVMDGWEATAAIRKFEEQVSCQNQSVHTTIIAFTANTTTEDREKCFGVGMDGFVSKPVSRDSVGSLMMELESGQYLSAASASQEGL